MADDPDDLDDLDAAMAAGGIMVVDESSSICSDHEDDEEEYEELSTVRTSWLIPSQGQDSFRTIASTGGDGGSGSGSTEAGASPGCGRPPDSSG